MLRGGGGSYPKDLHVLVDLGFQEGHVLIPLCVPVNTTMVPTSEQPQLAPKAALLLHRRTRDH